MTEDDVQIIEKTTPFQGHFRIERYRLRHRLFEGGWSDTMERELFARGHAVAAVLFDPQRDELVLIEQFRVGVLGAQGAHGFEHSSWLLECVAGVIEEGESLEDVVRRETREEAGLAVTDLIPACVYLASPGASSETVHVFCGRVDAASAGGVHGLNDENEDIRVMAVPVTKVFQWLDEGRFVSALSLVGLQWFRHRHDDLRRRWRGA